MNLRIAKKVEKNAGKRALPIKLLRAAGRYLRAGGEGDYQGRRVIVPVRRWDMSELIGGEIVIDRWSTVILRDDGIIQRGGQYMICEG